MTPQQINQLNQVYETVRNKYKGDFDKLNNVPEKDRIARWQDYQRTIHTDFVKNMNNILSPTRVNRYRQLYYQQIGPAAFSDPEIQKKLNLSDAQIQQFRDLGEVNAKELRGIYESKVPSQDADKRWQALMKQLNTDTGTILNENQRKQWAELLGQPYPFQPPVVINPNKGK
jgi:hypothetical protein